MKILAHTDNKDYFDQFVGTDYWVECENPSSTHGLYKYQYYRFSQPKPVLIGNQYRILGGYLVNSISSECLTHKGLSNRFSLLEVLNQIQGKYPYELNADQVAQLIPTGNMLTTDEIFEMFKRYNDEDIR